MNGRDKADVMRQTNLEATEGLLAKVDEWKRLDDKVERTVCQHAHAVVSPLCSARRPAGSPPPPRAVGI